MLFFRDCGGATPTATFFPCFFFTFDRSACASKSRSGTRLRVCSAHPLVCIAVSGSIGGDVPGECEAGRVPDQRFFVELLSRGAQQSIVQS